MSASFDVKTSVRAEMYPPFYNLNPAELSQLCDGLIAEYGAAPERYACFAVAGSSPYANVGRTVERKVFEESFGNDSKVMEREYGPYDGEMSLFFIAVDQEERTPAGVLRVIRNSDVGLKTLNDLSDYELKEESGNSLVINPETFVNGYGLEGLDDCWDIGTVAVLKRYRAPFSPAATMLYRALYATARAQGVQDWISVIDNKEQNNLDNLGVPFSPIFKTTIFNYLGSWAKALHCRVSEIEPSMRDRGYKLMGELAIASPRRARMLPFLIAQFPKILDGEGMDRTMRFDFADKLKLV